jgi:hypothetical protein
MSVDPWAVAEPWAVDGYPDDDKVERDARSAERAEEARRAERADNRELLLMAQGQQWAHRMGEPWDPANPREHVPPVDAQADMMEAAETGELRRAARRALQEAGLPLDLLRPAVEPAPDAPLALPLGPSAQELDAAQLRVARKRTDHAGAVARIRRWRRAQAEARS